tara:strand:+ start:5844 stop:7604 length:1761 start_codon:yes stop_codon:yes gene_type:complete
MTGNLSNYLITSPIKALYPKKLTNRLVFPNEGVLDNHDDLHNNYSEFLVLDPQWKNKKNILGNIEKLDQIYEKILNSLKEELNIIHKKSYSKNFWRIFIGPWLFNFIVFYFERWSDIENAFATTRIDRSIFIKLNEGNPASDYADSRNYFLDPVYKQKISQKILSFFLSESQISHIDAKLDPQIKNKNIKENLIYKILLKFNINKNKKYFFSHTGLGYLGNIKLNFFLKQLPSIYYFKQYVSYKKKNNSLRDTLLNNFDDKNNFETCLKYFIQNELPLCVVEDFDNFEKWSSKQPFPSNPKIIFSSDLMWLNSLSKYYLAKNREHGSKIIYRQHGAYYGMTKFMSQEHHERKASDVFLTWGWNEKTKNENLVKSGIRIFKTKTSFKELNKIIFTFRSRKRYVGSIAIGSYVSEKYSDYLKFTQNFLFSFNDILKKKTILRFPPFVKNIKTQDYFGNLCGNFYHNNNTNFNILMKQNNLFIHSNHSTAFLETLAHNCPTIGVWDDKEFILKDEYKKFYNQLKTAGLIFTELDKAKNFINNLDIKKIDQWWNQDEIQKSRINFINSYANTINFNSKKISEIILLNSRK